MHFSQMALHSSHVEASFPLWIALAYIFAEMSLHSSHVEASFALWIRQVKAIIIFKDTIF
jgi:hypothetical protein